MNAIKHPFSPLLGGNSVRIGRIGRIGAAAGFLAAAAAGAVQAQSQVGPAGTDSSITIEKGGGFLQANFPTSKDGSKNTVFELAYQVVATQKIYALRTTQRNNALSGVQTGLDQRISHVPQLTFDVKATPSGNGASLLSSGKLGPGTKISLSFGQAYLASSLDSYNDIWELTAKTNLGQIQKGWLTADDKTLEGYQRYLDTDFIPTFTRQTRIDSSWEPLLNTATDLLRMISARLTSIRVAPSGVTDLKASSGRGESVLTWTSDPHAAVYKVSRKRNEEGYPVEDLATLNGGAAGSSSDARTISFVDHTPTPLQEPNNPNRPDNGYTYTVRASNAIGNKDATVSTGPALPPAAPTTAPSVEKNAVAGNAAVVTFPIQRPESTAWFVIERSDNGEPFVSIEGHLAADQSPSVNYSDATVKPGHTYKYKVIAVNVLGQSPESAEITPPAIPQPDPLANAPRRKSRAIYDAWNLTLGYESDENTFYNKAQPYDSQFSDKMFQGYAAQVNYQVNYGGSLPFTFGILGGYKRSDNAGSLNSITVTDSTTITSPDGTVKRTLNSMRTGLNGMEKISYSPTASADLLFYPGLEQANENRAKPKSSIALALFVRDTPGKAGDTPIYGAGAYLTQPGNPSKFYGGINAYRDTDHKLAVTLAAGLPF